MSDLDLKALWQSQEPAHGPALDLDSVKRKAQTFERKIRQRNILEWVASAFVVVFFGTDALHAETPLLMVGNALVALAGISISISLWRKGRVQPSVDTTMDAVEFAESHAADMEAQARLLARVPIWYLGPFAIGMAVLMAGQYPTDGSAIAPWATTAGLVAITFIGIAWLNHRAARKLRAAAAQVRTEVH